MKPRIVTFVVSALLLAASPWANAETTKDWEWSFTPYLWGPSVSLDVEVANDPVIAADASLKELLDKTDFVGSFHFEGQCEHAGFLVDMTFFDLGADQTTAARPPLPGGTQTTVDLNIALYEAAGFYRPGGWARGFDLLLGARMYDYSSRLDATIPAPINATRTWSTDRNLIDGFAGVRFLTPIGKRWDFVVRGDVGTGGTDLSWNAAGSFGVRLGKTDLFNLRLGWRHMHLEVKNDDAPVEIESETTLTGPFFAFAMKF